MNFMHPLIGGLSMCDAAAGAFGSPFLSMLATLLERIQRSTSRCDQTRTSMLKAELHLHLEGCIPPELALRLAARHGIELDQRFFGDDGFYQYADFMEFMDAYDAISQGVRTQADFEEIAYEYLVASAEQGSIYTELFVSPDHAKRFGLPYEAQIDGVASAIERAHTETRIESRIVLIGVRHFGVESCESVANLLHQFPHPLVTGYGLAGDEAGFPPAQFARAFEIAKDACAGLTAHAGEWAGPDKIREAIETLGITRIGHGVRSIEDPKLIEEIVEKGITLEVCPMSNIALKVYQGFEDHPLRKLVEAGVKCTLSTDDPPFFSTSIAKEYAVAEQNFGLSQAQIQAFTRNAINAAFVDEDTRRELLAQLPA